MNLGLLVLRVVLGALFIGHGAQKLFGWFGGYGPSGTGSFFESLGLRPGRVMAIGAGIGEFAGGLLFALGLLTPLAAALLIAVMAVAVATVHWSKGLWVSDGGFEYNLVLVACAFALSAIGAGRWSLDRLLSLHDAGIGWALAALAAGLLGAILAIVAGRYEAERHAGRATPTAV
jgi:putative oxidoreductase